MDSAEKHEPMDRTEHTDAIESTENDEAHEFFDAVETMNRR